MNLVSKRLLDHFQPTPRFSNKLPALYLDSRNCEDDPSQLEVYLVNHTGKLIDWVRVVRGYLPSKDPTAEDACLVQDYVLVLPGEAVLLDVFDEIYDSDFLNQLRFTLRFRAEAPEEFSLVEKGLRKFRYKVLTWSEDNWSLNPISINDASSQQRDDLAHLISRLEYYFDIRGITGSGLTANADVGCYYCLAKMPATDLGKLHDTAIRQTCPECGINALIPAELGIPLERESLETIRHIAFSGHMDDPEFTIKWDDKGQ